MRIIIEDSDDWVLQVRAARAAIEHGLEIGGIFGIKFGDGHHYGVKRNKESIRVYPQGKITECPSSPSPSAPV